MYYLAKCLWKKNPVGNFIIFCYDFVCTFGLNWVYPAVYFTMDDLFAILPVADPLLVVRIPRRQQLEAFLKGVLQTPMSAEWSSSLYYLCMKVLIVLDT